MKPLNKGVKSLKEGSPVLIYKTINSYKSTSYIIIARIDYYYISQ